MSLYPAFYDGSNQQVLLVNEDVSQEQPHILRYNLTNLP